MLDCVYCVIYVDGALLEVIGYARVWEVFKAFQAVN